MWEELSQFMFPEGRLDWFDLGPGSANKTGAFLAVCSVGCLYFILRFKWRGKLLGAVCFVFFWLSLLQTGSRGGLLAGFTGVSLVVGLSCFWFYKKGRLQRKHILSSIAVLLCFSTVTIWYVQETGTLNRITTSAAGEDESTNVRLAMYKAGLAMLTDAPLGWGHERVPLAYSNWYQEMGDTRTYLSLVNSHLTWMASYGVFFVIFYTFAWWALLIYSFPLSYDPLRIALFSALVCLGIVAFFSTVLTYWLVSFPVLILLFATIIRDLRNRNKEFVSRKKILITCVLTVTCLVFLYAASFSLTYVPEVKKSRGIVHVGEGTSDVVLVIGESESILGKSYGQEVRELLTEEQQYLFVKEISGIERLPDNHYNTIFLLEPINDKIVNELPSGDIILLNPPVISVELESPLFEDREVWVVLGSFSDWRKRRVWQSLGEERENLHVVILQGVADYIPGWPQLTVQDLREYSF